MEHLDEIAQLREKARDAQIANKIMDSLRELRLGSYENNSRRWVWELIQNAKDVAHNSQGVDIVIDFDVTQQTLEFKHNGKLFTMENLVFLIEQVSTKEREIEERESEKTTGKFGTGFLTTNLLSEFVTISGYMSTNEGKSKPFKTEINRSGKSRDEIIDANRSSFQQLRECLNISDKDIIVDEKEYNTIFTYTLNQQGVEVAENGIRDIGLALPYVFAFVPELNTVRIESTDCLFSRGKKMGDDQYAVQKVIVSTQSQSSTKYIGVMQDDSVAVAVELEKNDDFISFVEFPEGMPKVFCDFPLIGTEDFAFPVVVNSPMFNPTEPRNGIYIKEIENDESDENKKLLLKALELYVALLKRSSNKNYLGHYNVVKIREPKNEAWLSVSWMKDNIVNKLKQEIVQIPIVDTTDGEKKKLADLWGDPNIWIVRASTKEKRERLWDLLFPLDKDRLPKRDEIHDWEKSLWKTCNTFEVKDLLARLEGYENLSNLKSGFIHSVDEIEWLNALYVFLAEIEFDKTGIQDMIIFPNQEGTFSQRSTLLRDNGIDEEYKDILSLMGDCIRKRLLFDGLDPEYSFDFPGYGHENVFEGIRNGLADYSTNADEIHKRLVTLYTLETENALERQELIGYANVIFDDALPDMKLVNKASDDLLESAVKYVCTEIADKVSDYGSIVELESNSDIPAEKGKEWLVDFIGYIQKRKYLNLLDKKTKPILPNQNNDFKPKEELYLDTEELEEVLKDTAKISGYDIREELLVSEIFLELPSNREKSIKDISGVITDFVRKNRGSQDEEIRGTFKTFYLWLIDNNEKAEEYFHDIYNNKHWLYNDYEIAENMQKAEKYDALLKRYEMDDILDLEKFLIEKRKDNDGVNETQKEEITQEILIESGITNNEMLVEALTTDYFSAHFLHETESSEEKFNYVKSILKRSKDNILRYLRTKEGYDISSIQDIDDTISIIEKNGEEIYLIMRPSDYKQVIIYYDTEKDIMDYEKDWELWIEDGRNNPEKITFGKILKSTGINRIPLEKIK